MRLSLTILATLLMASCGSSSTPTAPTPAPVTTLTFASDVSGYAGVRSYSFTGTGTAPSPIDVTVMANQWDRAVSNFRGTVLFDPKLVEVESFTQGEFMTQGNVIVTFSVTPNAARNGVVIRVDRPTSVLGATGSGAVVRLRFRAVAGAPAGVSPLQWTETGAFNAGAGTVDQLFGTQGGTITVRR